MARDINALHILARSGEIPSDVAERQLNSYLLAFGRADPRLVLPVADAPHHSLVPDLGDVVHNILAQTPLPGSLTGMLQQCLPTLCHPGTRVVANFTDSQGVLLNILLALVLGLYSGGGVKKPRFEARAALFTRLHGLLTSAPEEQTAFCRSNAPILLLACMEYVARVLPANAPSQTAFIYERDPATAIYFRRIPALCDEFRQALDTPDPCPWPEMRAAASAAIERLTRLKKSGVHAPAREAPPPGIAPRPQPAVGGRGELDAYWMVPCLLGNPSSDEYRILGQGLGLAGSLICHIQREVQV